MDEPPSSQNDLGDIEEPQTSNIRVSADKTESSEHRDLEELREMAMRLTAFVEEMNSKTDNLDSSSFRGISDKTSDKFQTGRTNTLWTTLSRAGRWGLDLLRTATGGTRSEVSDGASSSPAPAMLSSRMLMLSRETEKERAQTDNAGSVETVASASLTREDTKARSSSDRNQQIEDIVKSDDIYEVEVSWEGDTCLHDRKQICKKHPGHVEFIPVYKFEKELLPPRYRHKFVEELVRCLATMTVRLTVDKISPHRPGPPYPPNPRHLSLGRECSITGSGHVSEAIKYTEEDQMTCPCKECVNSGNPRTRWGKIYIHTAAHVVHDDLEAAHTMCSFFYDNDSDDLDTVIKVSGMERVEIDLNEDRCWMFCYTHDLALLEKLHKIGEQYEKQQEKVRNKYCADWYNVNETDLKLTIIVSHPHGCSKYVSIGEFVERHELPDDPDWTRYTYTTPTCPGSSGAPVFILGKKGWFDYHHHSGVNKDTVLNQSTFGLF